MSYHDPNDPQGFGPGGKPSLWKVFHRVNEIWNWCQSSGQSQIMKQLDRMEAKMTAMDDKLTALTADVNDENTAIDSAIALMGGISKMVSDAVAAALAAGATPAQLQAVTDLDAAIKAKKQAVADAVAANTPAAPPPGP